MLNTNLEIIVQISAYVAVTVFKKSSSEHIFGGTSSFELGNEPSSYTEAGEFLE
jgi:hypothetical protein